MKKCPNCGKTYADAGLNFCLQDGTVLEQETVSTFGNEETMVIGQAPSTNPGSSSYSGSAKAPPTWASSPYGAQAQPPKRKSRAWLWVLLIFLAFGLIAVTGFAGFLIYLGTKINDDMKKKALTTPNSANKTKWNSNANANNKTNTAPGEVKKGDFSKWKTGSFDYGKMEYKDNKLISTSSDADHYTVISAGKDFLTNDGITRVTVENISKGKSTSGYGLVVNASPIKPLFKDYAFLIRTGDNPAYKIVKHLISKETDLIDWTPSSAINGGDDENELEVRDEGSKLSFYINDELVTSIDDEYGTSTSIAGIYVGDGIPIAFSDLEIERKK